MAVIHDERLTLLIEHGVAFRGVHLSGFAVGWPPDQDVFFDGRKTNE